MEIAFRAALRTSSRTAWRRFHSRVSIRPTISDLLYVDKTGSQPPHATTRAGESARPRSLTTEYFIRRLPPRPIDETCMTAGSDSCRHASQIRTVIYHECNDIRHAHPPSAHICIIIGPL